MSKLKSKFITLLAVLLCSVLTLCASIAFLQNNKVKAVTYIEGNYHIIGTASNDLFNGTAAKKTFDSKLMNELYEALTAQTGATEDDVAALITTGNVASDVIRSRNSNQNVAVWLGGYKWVVTYITKDTSGNTILDLWMSPDSATTSSVFANHAVHDGSAAYPSSMYATSVVRVTGVNAGGYASINDTTIPTDPAAQNPKHIYAHYTMDNSDNTHVSLKEFIVQPKDVAYQATETSAGNYMAGHGRTYRLPNDAYTDVGSAVGVNGWYTASQNYWGKGAGDYAYDAWKNDYLWIPSLAETGNSDSNSNSYNGIWNTNEVVRSAYNTATWLRSGDDGYANNGVMSLTSSGDGAGTYTSDSLAVRPALHFNLTKAAAAANGVTYDNSVAFTKVNYTGNVVKVTIPDFKKLDIGTVMEGNSAAGSKADFNTETGEFTAQLPNNSETVNYEISVKPKDGFVWYGTDDSSTKYYKIHITPAPITVDWQDFSVKYDPSTAESLLYTTQPTSEVIGLVNFTIKYIILTPSESLSTVKPEEGDSRWADADNSDKYKATMAGMYRVWYKITAENHATKIENYTVTVTADSVTIKVSGNGVLATDVIYADTIAQSLTNEASLKTRIKQKITIVGSNGSTYDTNAVNTLMEKLDVKLFTWTVNGSKNYVSVNSNGHYNVGTYYFDFQYKNPADAAISFKWETNSSGREIHPEVTIEKRDINVNIVAATEGKELMQVYGDSPASMKYVVPDESELADNESVADLKLLDLFVVKGTTDEIGARTNVGEYTIEGLYDEGNYNIQFKEVKYKVTKRPVTLQIADEEVKYGTDFSNYKFGAMTVAEGKLVNGNSIETVTANADYYLWNNGRMELSSTLPPNEYELRADITSNNYDFTILAGKLTITKADYDMSGVKLENAGYLYDGKPHEAKLTGTLPSSSITVTFVYVLDGEESLDPPTEIGLYTVFAIFTHSSPYYNEITNKVAYLRIAETQEELDQGFPSETPDPDDVTTDPSAILDNKKSQAKSELEQVAKDKRDEIDNDPNLTDEEKKVLKDKVDEELQKGKDAIDSATSTSGVEQAFGDAKKEIEDIGKAEMAAAELESKKRAAKDELEKAAKDKNAEIDSNPDLTDEERAEAKKKVENELAAGQAAIDSATSADGIDSAKNTSETNIKNISIEHKEDSSFPWWIIALIAGVLLLLALLIIIIVKRRQVADGEDEYYDDYYDDEYDFDEDIEEEYDDGDFE